MGGLFKTYFVAEFTFFEISSFMYFVYIPEKRFVIYLPLIFIYFCNIAFILIALSFLKKVFPKNEIPKPNIETINFQPNKQP